MQLLRQHLTAECWERQRFSLPAVVCYFSRRQQPARLSKEIVHFDCYIFTIIFLCWLTNFDCLCFWIFILFRLDSISSLTRFLWSCAGSQPVCTLTAACIKCVLTGRVHSPHPVIPIRVVTPQCGTPCGKQNFFSQPVLFGNPVATAVIIEYNL